MREAARLLETSVLLDCGVLNWKVCISTSGKQRQTVTTYECDTVIAHTPLSA